MNYRNEYYKRLYIDDYLYRVIAKWLSLRLEKEDKEMFAGDCYSDEDYRRDMKTLEATKHKEELLYLISDDYVRIAVCKALNYLKSGSLNDIPGLLMYGLISCKGFPVSYAKDKAGYMCLLDSPVYRHIEEDLFRMAKEDREIYARKLVGIIAEINQRYDEKAAGWRKKMLGKTGQLPVAGIQAANTDRQLPEETKETRRRQLQLLFDIRYFKVKVYGILKQFGINLIDIARSLNKEIIDEDERHLFESIQATNTSSEEELIKTVEKSIEINSLKPRITSYNKPQLNKGQIVVLFNVLRRCEILNKDVMRRTMDTAISLLTGYSEKQIHKGTNTPVNEILNTKESVTQIQNLLEKAIDLLENEKKEINR